MRIASVTPNAAISTPPTAAPKRVTTRLSPSYAEVSRISGTPAASATGRNITCFTRSPMPRSAPASATSATSEPKPNHGVSATTTMATALPASQRMDVRRRPIRSAQGVPSALDSRYGRVSANATRPILVGLPVVTSTSHGMVTTEMRVPRLEIRSAPTRTTSCRRGVTPRPPPPDAPRTARAAPVCPP